MRSLLAFALASSPAFAGDDAGGPPITEFLLSTVIETADYGVLPGFGGTPLIDWASDEQKLDFLDEDEPLPTDPTPVPLPGAMSGMVASLLILWVVSWVLG